MSKLFSKFANSEPNRSIIYLGTLLLLRALSQVILYERGFLSVAADEYARGIAAARWALQPTFDLFGGSLGPWLPFEKYVNGFLLTIWPDAILAPRVTVFLSSCLALIALYAFVYYLFRSFSIAVLTTTFVAFLPWYAWLSGTPMLEMYYFAFYLTGLFFLVVWLRENRRGFWILAGCSFMITSGFHVQSWVLINVVNLLTVGFLIRFIRYRQYGRLGRIIGYYFLSNLVIITLILVEFAHSGELLAFLGKHTSYSKWFYGGYNIPVLEKLSYYPSLVLNNVSPVIWLLVIAALIFLRKDRDRGWKLFPFMLALLALAIFSLMNVFSGPPSAAPDRYSLFYTMMLAPYVAYGTYHTVKWALERPQPLVRYSVASVMVGLYIYSLGWGAVRAAHHPVGPWETIDAGRSLNVLFAQNDRDGDLTYMLELTYWDFLAFQLAAGQNNIMVLDREQDIRNRQTPSIFEQESATFYDILSAQHVDYLALRDSELQAKVQQSDFLSIRQAVGGWTIYQFNP